MTDADLQRYDEEGYLFLPALLTHEEVAVLRAQVAAELDAAGPRAVLEADGRTVRAIHGSHAANDVFGRMVRLPRLLEPAEHILGSRVYVHQFKINVKAAFAGDVWKWHQDFIFWFKQDGMREPRAVNAMVFLDEVTEFNGPLLLVPGSHRGGVIEVPENEHETGDWTRSVAADLKYAIPNETLASLVASSGIVAPKGPAGSVLLTHCNVVHGSAPNMSPFSRALAIVTYNSVENALLPVAAPRPEFLVSRNFEPLTPVGDDALLAGQVSGANAV